MSDPWINRDGEAVHPNAPKGGSGCGASQPVGALGRNPNQDSKIPDPRSPAGRHLTLNHDQERHLKARSAEKNVQKQYAEVDAVLHAIAMILNEGEMPPAVPAKYRDALQELADAREDRTDERKRRFEHSVRELASVFTLSDTNHMQSAVRSRLKIDGLIARWRIICSGGPAPLPNKIVHYKYEYTYIAQGGESVLQVAQRFGHANADPLSHPAYGYAPNMRLAKGDTIYVPFPPHRLENFIEAAEKMIEGAHEGLEEAVERLNIDKEHLESFLTVIEAMSILIGMAAAATSVVKLGAKGAKAVTHRYAEKITEEVAEWGIEEGTKTSAELLGMALEASRAPKKGLMLALRHTPIGWLSPNYWASLVAALWNGEHELFLYGPEGIEQKRCETLGRQTKRYIQSLKDQIADVSNQLNSPIYKSRLQAGAQGFPHPD